MNAKIAPTDLTQRPPRSFHVRLGGFVILLRMLDKGWATLAKQNGEYKYNSDTDQHLVRFLGFDPEALLKELAAGKGDGEILGWVPSHSKIPRAPWEIEVWLTYMEKRGPDSDGESLTGFAASRPECHPPSSVWQREMRLSFSCSNLVLLSGDNMRSPELTHKDLG
jgi:hypothetical protein